MRVAGPKTPALSTFAGQVYSSLVLGDLSRVGYGAILPLIAYSPNRVLELANASSRAKDTRIKYCRRTGVTLIGAWRPEPSGIQRLTASHRVFAK